MPQRSTLELLVVQCEGGRGHCRRGTARRGSIVVTRHRGIRPATVRLDCGPGLTLSATGLERAHELAALYGYCHWSVEATVAGSHLKFDLQPPRSRSASLAAVVDVVTEDLFKLARLHAIAMPDEERP